MQPVRGADAACTHPPRYFSEAASLLPTILSNVLHNFYATAALSTSPLIIIEYGRCAGLYPHSCPAPAVNTTAQMNFSIQCCLSYAHWPHRCDGPCQERVRHLPHDAVHGCHSIAACIEARVCPGQPKKINESLPACLLHDTTPEQQKAVERAPLHEQCRAKLTWLQTAFTTSLVQGTPDPCFNLLYSAHHGAHAHRQSGSPYSASLQSDAVAAEAKTLKNFARNSTYPYFLGVPKACVCPRHMLPDISNTA